MEMNQLHSRQKQLTVGDLWPENKRNLLVRPMSYSDSVKQQKPHGNGERSPAKTSQKCAGHREQIKLNTFERFRKDRTRMRKSLEDIEDTYSKQKVHFDKIVSSKKKSIKETTGMVNRWFFDDQSVRCKCQKNSHDEQSCFENVSNNIIDGIFALNASMSAVKSRYNALQKKNKILRELLDLECDNENVVGTGEEEFTKSRRQLQSQHKALEKKLDTAKERLEEARKLQEEAGNSRQEEFMRNRVKMLTEQVDSRIDDMEKIDEELAKARKNYEEKYTVLESLQEHCKDIKKELSEAILNRRQFNLCLKENFSYDQRLREVLEEREKVQYEYGAVMEDITAMQSQYEIEEKSKEKWCMSIVARLNEGQQYRVELESINGRVNQMHSEIFVRHCFMHAKEIQIKELTERCKKLEEKILASSGTELSLKTGGEELQRKLTEILFDICFAISWNSVGEEDASGSQFIKPLNQAMDLKTDSKEPCEYTDLDEIEQESFV